MQPIHSPDGRYWWDGRHWQLVPGAPVQGPPPPGTSPPGPPAPGPRRPQRVPLIIGLAVLVLVIIAVPFVYVATRTNTPGANPPPGAPASPTPAAPTLKPGERITKEKLSQVSATDFLYESLARQMTQPAVQLTNGYFQTPANFTNHDLYYLTQVGIDHRTGADAGSKDTTLSTVVMQQDKPEYLVRCVDGKAYQVYEELVTHKLKWIEAESTSCASSEQKWTLGMTDGIVPNGLKPDQADTFIKALREEYPGFVKSRQPTLFTSSGRTYVRQIVDYTPTKLQDGTYWGTQIFLWAFKETGLDPQTWPFPGGLGPREGLHVAYYLDPKTLLPVAAVIRSTPVLAEDGSVEHRYDQTQVWNYRFPARLTPLNLKDKKSIPLLVPEGWKIPS